MTVGYGVLETSCTIIISTRNKRDGAISVQRDFSVERETFHHIQCQRIAIGVGIIEKQVSYIDDDRLVFDCGKAVVIACSRRVIQWYDREFDFNAAGRTTIVNQVITECGIAQGIGREMKHLCNIIVHQGAVGCRMTADKVERIAFHIKVIGEKGSKSDVRRATKPDCLIVAAAAWCIIDGCHLNFHRRG